MERSKLCFQNEEQFAVLYVGGPDDVRGNGTRTYLETHPNCNSEHAAAVGACRLLSRARVRARVRELRDEAAESAKVRLRSWWELAPDAQRTLELAARGELRFPDADPKLEPELIRSAVRASVELLDRAMGTVKHMHEHQVAGPGIVVHVAGPGEWLELDDRGRVVEVESAQVRPELMSGSS